MAAGEAGEKLRIARINQSSWAWNAKEQVGDQHRVAEDVQLELAIIDPDSWQDECLWASDGLPFTQIKFATHNVPNEPIRWLLAQKATSTSILSPEYHKVPVGDINVEALDFNLPSKIDPMHELTITHHQTGGRVHCDVAFNPPTQGSAAQICIMDECGYWTIWAIVGRTRVDKSLEKRAVLRKQGSVYGGILPDISLNVQDPSRPHGALYIGLPEGAEFQSSFGETQSTSRSPYILVWNPDKFEVADFEDGTLLQRFELPKHDPLRPTTILDAQVNPVSQTQAFVLTSQSLLWIEVPRHGLASKPTLLLQCPHLPGTKDVRMSISRASDEVDTVMVFLYAPGGTHFSVNWFRTSEESELPQWHREVLPMVQNAPGGKDPHFKKLDMMLFHAAKLEVIEDPPESSLGEAYWKQKVLFFQGLFLSEDLGLRYCIASTTINPGLQVALPTNRLDWTPRDKERSLKRQKRLFLKRIGGAFVLPDGLEPGGIMIEDLRQGVGELEQPRPKDVGGFNVLNIYRAVEALGQIIEVEDGHRGPLLPSSSVDVLENILESGIAEASVPLFTW
jgi:RNA polymerase I-specific transcription initiation factor RRN6